NLPSATQPSTLSLHDALPISAQEPREGRIGSLEGLHRLGTRREGLEGRREVAADAGELGVRQVDPRLVGLGPFLFDLARELLGRSEEHTSELQSHLNLVCRLL